MISLDNITVRFGNFTLMENISLMINDRDRIGLVGRNGAGKTTLLRIMMDLQKPSGGKLVISGGQTLGYLPQQMIHKDGKSLYDEAMSAFSSMLEMEKRMTGLSNELAERSDFESAEYLKLVDELSLLHERYKVAGGGGLEAEVEKTLKGLGFSRSDMHRPTSEFSGGWRMRIELAKILLSKPDFILLDEPTNHLDIESIQWLENFLKDYFGGVIVISHDRVFLDKVCNRTIEISLGRITDYRVPYSKYVILRKERREQQLAAYKNQQKMIRDTEEFIDRFRYKATKAVQVQSRIKQLEKIERIEIEEEDSSEIRIKFPPAVRSGTVVVEISGLSKYYGFRLVLNRIDMVIERGQRVAFVGKNGEGKTTLSKIITGLLDYTGKCKIGHNVKIGYFAQNQDELMDENKTVFETVDAVAVGEIRTKMRDILGAFLFSGEDVDKKVKVLSGGERSRLSLACLLLQPYNLLILDEPTNHLDMRSKDILKNALKEYDGTLIVVSHDREFLDGLVEKVYEFRSHKIKQYIGGIYDFLQSKKIDTLRELERNQEIIKIPKTEIISDQKAIYQQRKEQDKEIRKLKAELERLETRIENIEKEMRRTSDLLSSQQTFSGMELYDEYERSRNEYDSLLNKWEQLNIELERLMLNRF